MNKYLQHREKNVIVPTAAQTRAGVALFPHLGRVLPYLVAALLALLGVSYLIELNIVAAKGFALRSAESHLSDLKDQHKKLQVEVAQKESLAGMAGEIDALSMVPVHQVEYLVASGASVAVR